MDELTAHARKITFVLFAVQSLGSAGFIAGSTVNSILGAKLGGGAAWSGVPSAVYILGSALAAVAWGNYMERSGRRSGIVLGLLLGLGGAAITSVSVIIHNLLLFLLGLAFMGAANAAVNLGRFAAAEVHPPKARGRAISLVVLGGTFGAVFGPLLVSPAGSLARLAGVDDLAGVYAASLVLFALGMALSFWGMRPEPKELARQVEALYPEEYLSGSPARQLPEIFRQPAVLTATCSMIAGQVVMVMVMVITSLHMKDHMHGLDAISLVISSHTVGMYAFSLVSGWLLDRWGRLPVITAGAATLILACLAATLSPDVLPLAVALFLLGLGWNFCYVGGSTLLADQLSPAERSNIQGVNDLLVGLASAAGSLGSGLVFAAFGYAIMAYAGAFLAGLPLLLALLYPGAVKVEPANL